MQQKYEVATVFLANEAEYRVGYTTVQEKLSKLATISKEEDMGVRNFAYTIKKHMQGHYYVFFITTEPEQAHQIEHELRLITQLLRVMVIKNDPAKNKIANRHLRKSTQEKMHDDKKEEEKEENFEQNHVLEASE